MFPRVYLKCRVQLFHSLFVFRVRDLYPISFYPIDQLSGVVFRDSYFLDFSEKRIPIPRFAAPKELLYEFHIQVVETSALYPHQYLVIFASNFIGFHPNGAVLISFVACYPIPVLEEQIEETVTLYHTAGDRFAFRVGRWIFGWME